MNLLFRTITLPALALCAALAAPGLAKDAELTHVFDGGARPEKAELLRKPEVPALAGEAKDLPEDFREARGRWGNDVQMARIRRAHPEAKESFRVAVIGDSEQGRFFWSRWWSPGKDVFLRQLRAIHAEGPDFIIQLGDSVSKAKIKYFRAYYRFLDKYVTLPILHLIGNHDRAGTQPGPKDKSMFKSIFGEETDFFLDHNGRRFIVLDSADYLLTGAQLDWLEDALDTPLPKLVFTHMPPIALKGKFRSKDNQKDADKTILQGFFDEGTDRFCELVSKAGVERVYVGHIHAFGTATHKGVRYVMSGGGGSPLYPLPPSYPKRRKAHYVTLHFGPAGLVETVRELDGTTFDIAW